MGYPIACYASYKGVIGKLVVGLVLVIAAVQVLWARLTNQSLLREEEEEEEEVTVNHDYRGQPPLFQLGEDEDEDEEEVVESFMVQEYYNNNNNNNNTAVDREVEEQCTVCLCELSAVNRAVSKLPRCCHVFHRECIRKWVSNGHRTCPLCRTSLNRASFTALIDIDNDNDNDHDHDHDCDHDRDGDLDLDHHFQP